MIFGGHFFVCSRRGIARERHQPTPQGSESPRHRRQQDHPQDRGNAACQGRLRGLHGGRRLRRAREGCRLHAGHRVRGHHDAAARRVSDLLAHQAQQSVQIDSGDHAVFEGRPVRSRPRAHRRDRSTTSRSPSRRTNCCLPSRRTSLRGEYGSHSDRGRFPDRSARHEEGVGEVWLPDGHRRRTAPKACAWRAR